jgi:hypothetical protein
VGQDTHSNKQKIISNDNKIFNYTSNKNKISIHNLETNNTENVQERKIGNSENEAALEFKNEIDNVEKENVQNDKKEKINSNKTENDRFYH